MPHVALIESIANRVFLGKFVPGQSTVIISYASLPAIAPQPGKHTVLASFALHDPRSDRVRLLSLGAGVKCLPAHRLPRHGDALHDSHAEVIARRGAIRWLLEEVQRDARARGRGQDRARAQNENENEEGSRFESVEAEADAWVCAGADGLYALRDDVQLWMYASTVPCGDASMGMLASTQDPEVSARMDALVRPHLPPDAPSRGREGYARLGALRTKPGRADAPRIARWCPVLAPVYIHAIVLGGVDRSMREQVLMDCDRAFYKRLGRLEDLPWTYRVVRPAVHFTDHAFKHARSMSSVATTNTSNDECGWEVLINGQRRGISPKHRFNSKFRPMLSKISLLGLLYTTLSTLGFPVPLESASYHEVKQTATTYQAAKRCLIGPNAPFAGWVVSGEEWESFDAHGELRSEGPGSTAQLEQDIE
ncbi:hypothetical protein BJV77DRAFT_1060715 [Russula vinacea]|nr:hypothetical protein BJV77DRAFT_1060715 [Russula vinacea]